MASSASSIGSGRVKSAARLSSLREDFRGFPRFSEKHADDEVLSMLKENLTQMTDILLRRESALASSWGNHRGLLGIPLAREDHAEPALSCPLNMIRRIEEMRAR